MADAGTVKSVLQDWVMALGLRHQGVLLTAVRGCDDAPKEDPSKRLVRCYRAAILNSHCGEARQAKTFIEAVLPEDLESRFLAFRKNLDHYPHHYIAHILHAIEIVGYHHPDSIARGRWHGFYKTLCRGLHVNPETKEQLDERLGVDEETFGARDKA